MNKYKLGGVGTNGLRRVIALRSFGNVISGDVGGYIESEKNLSHEGNAWVYGDVTEAPAIPAPIPTPPLAEINISMEELIEVMLDAGCNIIQSKRGTFLSLLNQFIEHKQKGERERCSTRQR